jgi:hypothetical protein
MNLQNHLLLCRLAKAWSGLSICKVAVCYIDLKRQGLVYQLAKSPSVYRLAKARSGLSTCKVTFCSTDLQRHGLVYELAKSTSVLLICKGTS